VAINFEKKIPDWENVGAEPDAELKKGGFRAGYKPPAAYFNWFFNRISESVKEMQEKLVVNLKALAFKDKVGNGDITDIAAGKITQDSTHRMITDTERTNWNDVTNKVDSTGGDISNTKVSEFTASTGSYPVPAAGDTAKGAFGKIAKFFGDIRNTATGACFIGQIVNNCVTNRADLPLSAAQGKVLMDLYNTLNVRFGHIGDYYITNSSSNFTLPGTSGSAKLALSLWVPTGKYIVIFEAGCSSGISEVFIGGVMAFWNTANYVNSGTGFLNATTDTTIQVLLKGNGTIGSGQMRVKAIRIQ